MKLNTTAENNGVIIQNDASGNLTHIVTQFPGVYNVQFSAQLEKVSGGGSSIINIWLVKNGTNVVYTDTKIAASGSSSSSLEVPAWNFVLSMAANEYLQIAWYSSDGAIQLTAAPESTPPVVPATPGIPSVILTVNKIS